jgi:hypothetical protein
MHKTSNIPAVNSYKNIFKQLYETACEASDKCMAKVYFTWEIKVRIFNLVQDFFEGVKRVPRFCPKGYVKRMNRVSMFSNWIYILYCLVAENQPCIIENSTRC